MLLLSACSTWNYDGPASSLCADICETVEEIEEIYASGDSTGLAAAQAVLLHAAQDASIAPAD